MESDLENSSNRLSLKAGRLRALFIAGFLIQAIDCLVPNFRLSGETLRLWQSTGEVERLVSFFDLVRFCFRLGLLGWGFYNLVMLVIPFAAAILAVTAPRRWVFVAGSICGIWQLLFELVAPGNPEIKPSFLFQLVDHVAIVATLPGFWVKTPRARPKPANFEI